ncbi:pentapeptide repeat-containing protein [Kocuria sabuli]|uniref:pentapeptide repeat-containing protein n=1 Tax=Kocuria sabuli TaxID=3071448 RepID=UPI0034D4CB2D
MAQQTPDRAPLKADQSFFTAHRRGNDLNGDMEDPMPKPRVKAYIRQWYDDIAFWRHVHRWLQQNPLSLFEASFWALISLAIFAVLLWIGLGWILGENWAWDIGQGTETNRYSILRMVLFIGAGLVGVVGVVVTYRRQQGAEEGYFLERLAESARQLGDQNPIVQAAGIYALAGLADRSSPVRRQQCLDVLCAYLRMPYLPSATGVGRETTVSIMRKRTLRTRTGPIEEERTLSLRPHDRETRQTIVRIITQHIRKDGEMNWSNLDFDFTNAVFDYGDFTKSVFAGKVIFTGAQFTGGTVNFDGAEFAGAVNFDYAQFTGGTVGFQGAEFTGAVNFDYAQFTGGTVSFQGAEFTGAVNFDYAQFTGSTIHFSDVRFNSGTINFGSAKFTGGTVHFDVAHFSGGTVNFRNARFTDGTVNFFAAQFTGGTVSFFGTQFAGGTVDFEYAQFTGGTVDFEYAQFTGGTVDFEYAQFTGGTVDFEYAQFTGGTVNFTLARFTGGTVNFQGAKFTGGTVDFTLARFTGGTVNFFAAEFTGGTVNFDIPSEWAAPPLAPWGDGDHTPPGVTPDQWPPCLVDSD